MSFTNNGVVNFTAAETFDFAVQRVQGPIGVADDIRWGDSSGSSGPASAVNNDTVTGLNAFTVVEGTGIINDNNGEAVFIDLGFDAGADAFLFGRVDFVAVAEGVTNLETVAGSIGIVHDNATVNPVFGAANITVGVPEPTSAGLLAFCMVSLLARRRR